MLLISFYEVKKLYIAIGGFYSLQGIPFLNLDTFKKLWFDWL